MNWISPDWPVAANVRALTTTRDEGFSGGVWRSLNLGDHVGDKLADVESNRQLLVEDARLPSAPRWLRQVHGCEVADVSNDQTVCEADAVYSDRPGKVCGVLTADCLPLILANAEGTEVAAVHAGWRGLAAGVIEAAVSHFSAPPEQLLAWMGPAIGADDFEVGDDVREEFLRHDEKATNAFRVHGDRWLADIYMLARQRLNVMGVTAVYGGDYSTFSDPERFFSYRRDGETGRMATLIWFE